MSNPSKYLDSLIEEFSKFPGIGNKSASRLAFYVLKLSKSDVDKFTVAINELKENIITCKICGGISDSDICSICNDDKKNHNTICVVESAKDILTIESTNRYNGVYHVLMGMISPLDGIGPDDLNISALIKRCDENRVEELILAFNSTIEADATSLYIAKILSGFDFKITRIAHGLPVGADLEFTDSATIIKSIEGRTPMK